MPSNVYSVTQCLAVDTIHLPSKGFQMPEVFYICFCKHAKGLLSDVPFMNAYIQINFGLISGF